MKMNECLMCKKETKNNKYKKMIECTIVRIKDYGGGNYENVSIGT